MKNCSRRFEALRAVRVCVGLLWCAANALTAQPISPLRSERIGSERGLSSRSATCALQDRYGFLWFGTQHGLNRWDGVTMTVFTSRMGDSTTLPNNAILHLHEDKRGTLWVATTTGLARFNRHNATFSTVLEGKPVADVHEDSGGTLWLWIHNVGAKTNELLAFSPSDGSSKTFTASANPAALRSAYIYSFLQCNDGSVWFGTANGLYRLNPDKSTFAAFLTDGSAATALSPKAHIHSLAEDDEGTLWIGTGGGVCSLPKNAASTPNASATWSATWVEDSSLPKGAVVLLCRMKNSDGQHGENQDGKLWGAAMQAGSVANQVRFFALKQGRCVSVTDAIPVVPFEGKAQSHRCAEDGHGVLSWGVGNGVAQVYTATGRSQLILHDPALPTRINAPVTAVLTGRSTDNRASLWCARLNGGVQRLYAVANSPFRSIRSVGSAESALAEPVPAKSISAKSMLLSPTVSALHETRDGKLWVGYMGGAGVSVYDRSTVAVKHFRQQPNDPTSVSGFGGETTMYDFHEDAQGVLWLGSSAVDRFNAASGTFSHFPIIPQQAVPATALLETHDGTFWVGSTFGLAMFDKTQGTFKRFVNKRNDQTTLGNNIVNVLYEDRAKMLWVGHEGGLDRYDRTTKQFGHIAAARNNPASLGESAVTVLHEDAQGRFWVGTSSGLYLLDRASGTVTARYTRREGLPDDGIAAMLEDAHGNLWISTRRGLCRFSPSSKMFRVYGAADGIADSEFSDRAACRTRDGAMWFGAASGLLMFHPDSVRADTAQLAVILTGFKKFGADFFFDTFLADKTAIELDYGDKVFSIEYTALNSIGGSDAPVQYSYKLEGLDNDWVVAGEQRAAKYTSLSPGTYTFAVRAANSDGVWSATPTRLAITVRPPWWMTWWFVGGSVVLLVAAAFGAYKWRVRSMEQRNRELERQVRDRTRALQDANIEISRQMEILNEQAREIETSNTRLQEANIQLNGALYQIKDTQAQLVQSERVNAAGMLTAGVMHEINNPNASISSALEIAQQNLHNIHAYFLSLLDESDRNNPEATKFVEMLHNVQDIVTIALNGSERIRNIVFALQGFTKHQHEGMTLNSIAQEVHSTVVIFRYQFKDAVVEEKIDGKLKVRAHWGELNQALLNLLVNAAQAGATTLCLTASLAASGQTIVLRVTDDGSGMNPEVQQHIFEPFYTTKSVGNSGLGLSITKKIIEQNNGTISVESAAGKGTTFILELPAEQR